MKKKKLTKKLASELKAARVRAGMSQYKLAEVLEWPRSKVKRLEKAEVKTISTHDIRAWYGGVKLAKDVQETSKKRVKTRSSGQPRTSKPRRSAGTERVGMFRVLGEESRPGAGKNQVFFEVEMKKRVAPEKLLKMSVGHRGVHGHVHGVENTTKQKVLEPGDRVVIMVWGPGIAA